MPPDFAAGLSDGVLIALIGGFSAAIGGAFTAVNAHFKQKSDRAAAEADYALQKMRAADDAFKELREAQQEEINSLNAKVEKLSSRADEQWAEIVSMQRDQITFNHVKEEFLQIMVTYPDPPGAPLISKVSAKAIDWDREKREPLK